MQKLLLKKGTAVAVIVLFLGMGVIPSGGINAENHSSNDNSIDYYSLIKSNEVGVNITLTGTIGENGWYISWVFIWIEYGPNVETFWYQLNDGDWIEFEQSVLAFYEDGEYTFCWKYEDKDGNISDVECIEFKIDQTPPHVNFEWFAYKRGGPWYIVFTCNAIDSTSGMDRVEFYFDHELYETIEGDGPIYEFTIEWSEELKSASFTFIHYDIAGNPTFAFIDGDDIESHPSSQSNSIQQFKNLYFLRLLESFPLLQRLLESFKW